MSNELQLSKDINVITAEINSYKNVAGQAIFEIGRRLKYVKENDLVHGEWEKWCESTLDMSKQQANKYIKVFNEFSNGKTTYRLGVDALYLIATLPEEERHIKHNIPSTGEQKSVDEMTVRELKEVKKALKQAEEDKKLLAQKLTEERNKPKEVETKVVETVKEVIPEHIKSKLNEYDKFKSDAESSKKQIEQLNNALRQTTQDKLKIENKLNELNTFENKEKRKIEELRLKEEQLKHQAHISIFDLQIKIHNFINEASPSVFLQGAVASSSFKLKDDLLDSVIALEEFTKSLRDILDSKIEMKHIVEVIDAELV